MTMANTDIINDLETFEIPCHIVDTPETCKTVITRKHNLEILALNIRSIHNNFDQFLVTFMRLNINFDFLIFTECWLYDGLILKDIDGYSVFRSTIYTNQNGGVVAYVNNKWTPEVIELELVEANCLRITVANNFSVLAIYRSPATAAGPAFLKSLTTAVKSIKNCPCILVDGDININTCSEKNKDLEVISKYLTYLAELNLFPAVTKPTRGPSCLDHIHVNVAEKSHTVSVVCRSGVTDHDIVMAGIVTKLPKNRSITRLTRKIYYQAVKGQIGNCDWDKVLSVTHVDDAVAAFEDVLHQVINKHSKLVSTNRSNLTFKPWMTPGLIR